ncbi:hypothetical protein GWI33_021874 [Rhynchophorus ferrugineus]|uniref:Fanconi-associated nuclease n=1 Tax=Rhynchophorus ferrugineus TaxID=354439 RepID=A0A834J0U9_RHYFE|nr:hypothetical protein GWI33_021874 [Rhynchophorus ferrugineus]
MEPFNRTCQSQSAFKFRTPILVSNVIYEVNSDEESLQLDLDKIVPCECTSKCQPKINILSVLEISNNNFRCNEPEKKCNVSAKKEHKSSSVSEANHIKCNSKNTQNKIQNNTSQSLRDCEDKNKRPSKKENLTSPKKLKVIPKSNVTDEGNILNTKSFEGKVQKLQFVTESNPSPVSSKQLETSKGTSDVNYLKAKKQKVSQGKELKAFVNLLSSVYESSDLRNLLSKDEHQALNTFLRLNNKHQYPILKLLIWKKNWYNIFKFCEEANIEIQDSKDVIDIFQSLDSSGFVDINYHKKYDNIPSLLESLSKNNIVNIMTALKMKSCKSKSENICKIIALIERQQTDRYKKIVMSLIQEHMGLCVKLSIEKARALHNVYTLATFTNSMFRNIRDSLNCEIMCPCSTIEHFLIFSRRIQFENYAEALQIYNQLDAIKSKTNKIGILDIGRNIYEKLINLEEEEPEKTTPHLYKFRAEYIYIKILTECCRNISTKKTGFPEDVMTWLEFLITKFPEHKGLGEWYYKLIWLYMNHIEPVNYEKASVIMIQALTKCKGDEISLYKLANLAKIIKKSKKHKLKQFYHDKITYKMPRLIKETDIPTDHINLLKSSNIKKGNKKMFVVKELLNGEINLRNMTQLAILYYEQDGYQVHPETCQQFSFHQFR